MAGLIERNAKIPMTLKQRSGIVDGKSTYTDVACCGVAFDFTQADFDYFGTVKNGKIFLIAPLASDPVLPGQVVHAGKTYEIKGLKTYRSLKGVVLGYRIAVSGA